MYFYLKNTLIHRLDRLMCTASMPLLLALTMIPSAHSLERDSLKLSGFATIGLSRSNDEALGYRRNVDQDGIFNGDWSFKTDTLLGLQIDAAINEQLSTTLQLVGKDRAENDIEKSIEWAYARYRINPEFTVRIGRIGYDLFMLSDHRNVGFSYTWVRPPMEFYTPIAFSWFEGLDLTYSIPMGNGTFSTKVFYGISENNIAFEDNTVEIQIEDFIGFNLVWENETWRLRAAALTLKLDNTMNEALQIDQLSEFLSLASVVWPEAQQIISDIDAKGDSITYHTLGAAYDKYPWQVLAEISYYDSDNDVLKPYGAKYISIGYKTRNYIFYGLASEGSHTNSRTTVAALPDAFSSNEQLNQLRDGVQTLYDRSYSEQRTFALGVRWNFRYDMAANLQWDHTQVQPAGAVLWKDEETLTEEHDIDIYSLSLDYIF